MIALPVAFLIGCASEPTPDMLPGGQPTFDSYAIQAKAYVAERRHFVTDDHVAEIEGNSPFEIQPKNPNGQAVLMIHGLGDSPWTFTDIGKSLADQGYLVRGILSSSDASSRTRYASCGHDRRDLRRMDKSR